MFAWDDGAPDCDKGLIKDWCLPIDHLLAELPGILLESDYVNYCKTMQEATQLPYLGEADQVIANSNLTMAPLDGEITGVDLPHEIYPLQKWPMTKAVILRMTKQKN